MCLVMHVRPKDLHVSSYLPETKGPGLGSRYGGWRVEASTH